MARTTQVRRQLVLPKEVSGRLEAFAPASGVSRSRILAEVLTAWLDRKRADEVVLRFARRVDRLSNQLLPEEGR